MNYFIFVLYKIRIEADHTGSIHIIFGEKKKKHDKIIQDRRYEWIIHVIWATIVAQSSMYVGTVCSLVDIFMTLGLYVSL